MNILLQFIAVFAIFLITGYFSWWFTERDKVPAFLDYRPFSCRTCLNFWLLVGIYAAIGISFKLWAFLIAGVILAGLNAIAMIINQKNRTISVNELE